MIHSRLLVINNAREKLSSKAVIHYDNKKRLKICIIVGIAYSQEEIYIIHRKLERLWVSGLFVKQMGVPSPFLTLEGISKAGCLIESTSTNEYLLQPEKNDFLPIALLL